MSETHQPYKLDFIVNHPFPFSGTRDQALAVGAGLALAETLGNANIDIAVDGKTEAWEQPHQATLFVGDHTSGLEDLVLLTVLAQMGRQDVRFTAKPHSNLNHVLAMLGQPEEDHMIPLLPRTLARGRKGGSTMDRLSRRMFAEELLEEDDIRQLNKDSLQRSADALANGEAVNIFPTGTINKNGNAPWQRGVGEIIKLVPEPSREETLVVPYKVEGVKLLRFFSAIALSNMGFSPKRQEVLIRVGRQETIDAIFSSTDVNTLSGKEATSTLEERFRTDLY